MGKLKGLIKMFNSILLALVLLLNSTGITASTIDSGYRKQILIPYLIRNEGRGNYNSTTGIYKPYKDPAGHATIGYGHLIRRDENYSGGITEQQAQALLDLDIHKAARGARIQFNNMFGDGAYDELKIQYRAALVGVQFNTGSIAKFPKFSLALYQGDIDNAIDEIKDRGYRDPKTGKIVRLVDRNLDFISTFLINAL